MRVAIGAVEIHPPKTDGVGLRTYISSGTLRLDPSKDSCMLDVNNLIKQHVSATLTLCIYDRNIFLGKFRV